jgi:N utilization substance protein B
MTTLDGAARHQAREAALQMLYQWEVGRVTPEEAVSTYWPSQDREEAIGEDAREFADALVLGTVGRVGEADGLIATHARNWRVERMAVIDRLVLRMAIYELLAEPSTPAKVVINEAIELARTFSGEEAVPFVNGILDAVRKTLGRE